VSADNILNPRKPILWIGAIAIAAAMFASGALVTRALDDDGGMPASDDIALVGPSNGAPGWSAFPNIPASYGANDVQDEDGKALAGRGGDLSYPACRSPLPGGVVGGGLIDFAKGGFAAVFLGDGFEALSASVSVQGKCNDDGTPAGGDLVVDSSWKHTETGLEAYISQRKTDEKSASVLRPDSASFWANGYLYSVSVNGYSILPYATEDMTKPGTASTTNSGSGSDPGMRAPDADPRTTEVLRAIIAQLSPETDLACFWTLADGGWGALGAIGVGDPRSAIPSGYTETSVLAQTYTAPTAAGCDTSIKPTEGVNFNANWENSSEGGNYIGISVYGMYPGQDASGFWGSLSDYGANWVANGLQYSVYAKTMEPAGIDLIRKIAKALDPSFNETCFVTERELGEGELAGLGFNTPAADGFSISSKHLRASEIGAGCEKPQGFEPSYSMYWTLTNGGDTIEAGANRYGGAVDGGGSGYISGNSLNWTNASGTNFYLNAYSRGVSGEVSRDTLFAVAKSMDPSFDSSKLQDGGDGGDGREVMPAPAQDLPAQPR